MKFKVVMHLGNEGADNESLISLERICYQTKCVSFFTVIESCAVRGFLDSQFELNFETIINAYNAVESAYNKMLTFKHHFSSAVMFIDQSHIDAESGEDLLTHHENLAAFERDCGELKMAKFYLNDLLKDFAKMRVRFSTLQGAQTALHPNPAEQCEVTAQLTNGKTLSIHSDDDSHENQLLAAGHGEGI